MRYQGGKVRLAKYLVPAMGVPSDGLYIEPFLGGAAMMTAHSHVRNRVGADTHGPLIAMHRHIQSGGVFQVPVSKSLWEHCKRAENGAVSDALRGFVGFGSSAHGRYYSGWVGVPGDRKQPGNKRTLSESTLSCLIRDRPKMLGVKLVHSDYKTLAVPDGAYVYCDPPYAGTDGYSIGRFDHTEFWDWASDLSLRATVFVSELTAPPGWSSIWSKDVSARSSGRKRRTRQESLWIKD